MTIEHTMPSYRVYKNKKNLYEALWEHWCIQAEDAIRKRGTFHAALSGGSTPMPFFRLVAEQSAEIKWNVNWNKTHLYIVDERFVPIGHEDHNFTNIKTILDKSRAGPPAAYHAIPTKFDTANECAFAYEQELKKQWGTENPEYSSTDKIFPIFDLILLGLGTDGHTASLFPGSSALNEKNRWVVPSQPNDAKHERITLSYPAINHARDIVFLIIGANKAEVSEKLKNDDEKRYPASSIKPEDGSLHFFMDEDAAGFQSA